MTFITKLHKAQLKQCQHSMDDDKILNILHQINEIQSCPTHHK